jgi:hypothetical protein
VVKSLHDIWKRDKTTRKGDFIDLSDKSQDQPDRAWCLEPDPEGDQSGDQAGLRDAGFPLRKDMVDNAVGYRGFSTGAAWTVGEQHKGRAQDAEPGLDYDNARPWSECLQAIGDSPEGASGGRRCGQEFHRGVVDCGAALEHCFERGKVDRQRSKCQGYLDRLQAQAG